MGALAAAVRAGRLTRDGKLYLPNSNPSPNPSPNPNQVRRASLAQLILSIKALRLPGSAAQVTLPLPLPIPLPLRLALPLPHPNP